MARFPGAIYKPITASKGRRRLTEHNRVNLHVAAGESDSLHAFFNRSGIPDSHFYVRYTGVVEQYVDTAYNAFADLEGNDATISIETEGLGPGSWTAAQIESLAQLYAWAVKTHGVAKKLARSSKTNASSHGLSCHRYGIDGNFPSLPSPLAGRIQRGGGMHWSTSRGKECPGDKRVKQIPDVFARALEILDPAPIPTPAPVKETDDMQYKGTSTNQKQPVKSGAWTGLKIADGASYSILTAPHASFNSQVDLRVSGLPVGAVLQARFAIYDTAKKAYTVNYPIQEIHGSTGDAFGSLSLNNAITSEGKLLRVRFIGPDGATIVSASARTIYSA